MSYITEPGGEYASIHYLEFDLADERDEFSAYAINHPDGLRVARGAPGNVLVTPYKDIHNNCKSYMFGRWESEEAFLNYKQMRKETAPTP